MKKTVSVGRATKSEAEPIEFEITGYDRDHKPIDPPFDFVGIPLEDLQGLTLTDIVAAAERGDKAAVIVLAPDFIFQVLSEKDGERFNALARGKEVTLDADSLFDLAMWLLEVYLMRPLEAQSSSNTGPPTTPTSSTATGDSETSPLPSLLARG